MLNLNNERLWHRPPVHDLPARWVGVPVRLPWCGSVGLVYGHAPGTSELDLRVVYGHASGYVQGSQFLARLLTPLTYSDLTDADLRRLEQLEVWTEALPLILPLRIEA